MQKLLTYFKESWQELKRVTWPTKQQAARIVLTVIVFIIVATAILAGLDYLFNYGYGFLLDNV